MSDIKKFSGYLSSDGTPHKTQKLAIAHEQEQKVVAAVNDAFGDRIVSGGDVTPVRLSDFILANRDAIKAALNPEVLLRKKRVAKPKTTAPDSALAPAA